MRNERVYFIKPIGFEGPVKIGWSHSPDSRLENLMGWSPFPLEIAISIPGSMKLEKNIHECLHSSHSHREWFHPTQDVLSLVWKLKLGTPIHEAIDLSNRQKIVKPNASAWTDENRERASYTHRVRWAVWKLEKATGVQLWKPSYIADIVDNMHRKPLSLEDRSILNAFLDDPKACCQTRSERFPKRAAA
jgi:hypothetical protein